MAKKKASNKVIVGAAKPVTKKSEIIFDVPEEDPVLSINITDDSGKVTGQINSTLCTIHRMGEMCRADAFDADDMMQKFSDVLSVKFGVKVSTGTAYRIFHRIYDLFADEKKSISTS